MSLNAKKELVEIAKQLCRDLRKRSTKAEGILWEELRNGKLDNKKFYRQYPIFYDLYGKESFFIADFFCFETKLVIEVDGPIHDYRLKEDEHRTEILNCLGLTVLRFKNNEIEERLDKVLGDIKSKI